MGVAKKKKKKKKPWFCFPALVGHGPVAVELRRRNKLDSEFGDPSTAGKGGISLLRGRVAALLVFITPQSI